MDLEIKQVLVGPKYQVGTWPELKLGMVGVIEFEIVFLIFLVAS